MRPVQKTLTTLLWCCAILAMITVIGAGYFKHRDQASAASEQLPVLGHVPAFSLTDQDAQPISLQTFSGHPWIATFIFTRCPGPCPIITAKLASLQKTLKQPDLQFVSISVDPENDTPPVLKAYEAKYDGDPARWKLLTGTSDSVQKLARGMFITALPATGDQPIIHSEKFVLVDGDGQIRGYYDNADPQEMKQLPIDAARVAGE
jgi:protein SCO1/2